MSDFLLRMATGSAARSAAAQAQLPLEQIIHQAQLAAPAPELNLSAECFDVIAEVKKRSPSAGVLSKTPVDVVARASAYARHGAAAVSVLTEPEQFHGSLQDMRAAADALNPLGVPVMRKDFLVDAYQVYEARAAGAGGVLLILGMLDDDTLLSMLAAAHKVGMFVLLEAFDRAELARAAALPPTAPNVLLGLNTRDLRTLAVDTARLADCAPQFPARYPRVAESGLSDASDASRVVGLGYQLALVGSALMREHTPGELLREMIRAGRDAAMAERSASPGRAPAG